MFGLHLLFVTVLYALSPQKSFLLFYTCDVVSITMFKRLNCLVLSRLARATHKVFHVVAVTSADFGGT